MTDQENPNAPRRRATSLLSAGFAGCGGRQLAEAVAIAAEFERFEVEIKMLGGDPVEAMALVRRHHETGGSEGATGDTVMHRLRQGVAMSDDSRDLVWSVHDVPHRPGGRRHQHMPDGTVRVLSHVLLALTLSLAACGPTLASDGGETFGETGETGTETGDVDGDGDHGPVGDGDGDGPTGDGDIDHQAGESSGNGRLPLVEFQCDADGVCHGRWDDTQAWSLVSDADAVAASVEISPPWECDPGLDVDVCIEVDPQGHVGCFWYQDGWAVAVAPSCSVSGDGWLDVGNDMRSKAT
jgi:hypothetical protein